jgi:hypothetical protein
MTEAEWNACTEPQRMLEFLRASGGASDRKLRLFACACVADYIRLMAPYGKGVQAGLDASELYADGLLTRDEWWSRTRVPYHFGNWNSEDAYSEALSAAISTPVTAGWRKVEHFSRTQEEDQQKHEGDLLRCIFGSLPFRSLPPVAPVVLTWNEGTVALLATAIYEERTFSRERMGVLADALEEAGCIAPELLNHLRGAGPHVRGCWVIDLLLGKS